MTCGSHDIEADILEFAGGALSLPANVRSAGLRSLLNIVGTAIGGSGEPAIDRLVEFLQGFSGPGTATLIGRSERADMLWAAHINAASANIFDFDDTHIPTVIHPSAPVAPALFALAEVMASQKRPVSGRTLLEAFIVGVETTCRLGLAAANSHYTRGWHITSTCGIFGAALASGRLLGLDRSSMHDALGNALAQCSGSVQTLGTMSKSLSVGHAARGGLLAALLAERGYRGPERPLTGTHGFFALYCDKALPHLLVEELGERWEILNNTFKPYPCGVVLNPVIEACLDLHRAGGFRPQDIVEIQLTGHPLLRQRTDRPNPQSGRLAQVSAQHAVAVGLLLGRADLSAFADESVSDPELRAFGKKLRFRDAPAFEIESAELLLRLSGGQEIVRKIECAKGSVYRPLSDAELEAKLRSQIAWRGTDISADHLVEAIVSLESSADSTAFLSLTTAGQKGSMT